MLPTIKIQHYTLLHVFTFFVFGKIVRYETRNFILLFFHERERERKREQDRACHDCRLKKMQQRNQRKRNLGFHE